MRNPRNQLIIAMVFAVLLGVIIVVAAKCSSTGSTAARTPGAARTATPAKTTSAKQTPSPSRGAGTAVPGRATDVSIVPPGGQPAPTQITVGPLPGATSVAQATSAAGTGSTSATPVPPTPVVERPASTSVPAGGTTYTVKPGDTLAAIAKMFGTTTTAIAQANGITNTSRISTGQRLRIPGAGTATTGSTTGGRVYIVQRGDNLSRIAAKYGVTVNAIVRANNLKNPSLIYAGQRLVIP